MITKSWMIKMIMIMMIIKTHSQPMSGFEQSQVEDDDNDHQVLDDQTGYDYDDHQDAQLADEWF